MAKNKQPLSRRWKQALVTRKQQLRQALRDLFQTPIATLMTLAVIGVTLALPCTLHLLLKNLQQMEGRWESNYQITLYLQKDLPETGAASIATLREKVAGYTEVARVDYLSRQAALEEFKLTSGFGSALDLLDSNPLPAVLTVVPKPNWQNPDGAAQLQTRLSGEQGVEQVKVDLLWLSRLEGVIDLVRNSVIGLSALLLITVVLIVSNTLRLTILNQRTEIEVLKLIGATDGYIQRPFLYGGVAYGLLGALFAWWLTEIMVIWSERVVIALAELYGSDFRLHGLTLLEGAQLLLLGAILGRLASWFAVRRHIRAIEPS